ncbi:unnamed protein product [Schistosoma curassoni]|uniref:t-SNARE coiled-coil homology domain-containing protein n=1 Tax=Schistosoma curassoni TaxID=6186 RepID=A0A183KPY5_9TREM|nr:unnamed protein product [Schistosoma curassoni]
MSQKSELTQLNSLCESIQQRTNESGVKNSLNQLLIQYHSLIKSCEDVLSKLQLVFMENREFQVLCNNIRNFLDTLKTELKSININEQNLNLSENHLNTITTIREKLRSYQPKLLELSDRADRICRASSTAALTMNQIFMTHSSQLDINDSVNTPVFTGYDHQHQLATNQNEINNLQTETIGSKAKRQLNEFRNEFNEINQQITELSNLDFADDLALLSHTQQQMQERTTSIAVASAAVGLNIHKGKSKILRYNKTCTSPITLQGVALKHLKSFTYLGSIIDEHGGSDADMNA